MELRGTIKGLASTFPKRKILIELETDGRLEDIEKLQGKDLDITFKVHREKRSLDANAFLWSCLGKMGGVLNVPAWDMYLYSLERYGKIHLHPNPRKCLRGSKKDVERDKGCWRLYECKHDYRREGKIFRGSLFLWLKHLQQQRVFPATRGRNFRHGANGA